MESIRKRRIRLAGTLVCCILAAAACTFQRYANVTSAGELICAFKSCIGMLPGMLLLCLVALTCWHGRFPREGRADRWALAAAVLFSQCWWWGMRYDNFDLPVSANPYFLLEYAAVSAGLIYLFYLLISCLLYFCISKADVTEKNGEAAGRKTMLGPFLLCMCVWSVYFILFYPGLLTHDSYYQITQALGIYRLTNEHPFLHTLMMAVFLKPAYLLFDNIELGIGCFLLYQMAVMALIVAYGNRILHRMGVARRVRIAVMLFYGLHPLVGMYSITLWKDIWISIMLLYYLLVLVKIVYLRDVSPLSWFQLSVAVLGVLFSKGTGIILVVFSVIGIAAAVWKKRKLCIRMISVVLLLVLLWNGIQTVVINQFHVTARNLRDTKSVPLQQIARVVGSHGEEISREDREIINEILPYDQLPALYNPRLSDPVKVALNEKVYQEDPGRYISLWLRLGKQFPKTYLSSFLCNSYGYWYPDAEYWLFQPYDFRANLKLVVELEAFQLVGDIDLEKYAYSESDFARRDMLCNVINSIRYLPGISCLFSTGGYFWGFFLLGILMILRKDRRLHLPLSMALGVFISCVTSPVYAEMRYVFPAICIFPFTLVLSLYPKETLPAPQPETESD